MSPSSKDRQSWLLAHPALIFPLSSPILEEIPSPATSSEEEDTEWSRPFDFLSKGMSCDLHVCGSEHTADVNERGIKDDVDVSYRTHEEYRDHSQASDHTVEKCSRKPVKLSLVTDFSEPSANRCYDALTEPNSLPGGRGMEKSMQRIRDVFRKKPLQGFHRLSSGPSVAGKGHVGLDTHEWLISKGGYDEDSALQRRKPVELNCIATPSVVITPAKEDSFWLVQTADYRRPRSSIYSQPTPKTGYGDGRYNIPPVPAIPALCSPNENVGSGFDSLEKQISLSASDRPSLTGAAFVEDEEPRPGRRSRAYSETTVKTGPASQRQSINSFSSKRRSQGWWTYLLSPLLSRSSTVASKRAPIGAEAPPIPSMSTISVEWWETRGASPLVPDTPENAASNQDGDGSANEASLPIKKSHEQDKGDLNTYDVTPFISPDETIQGTAAEYYQACAHELFSGRPYFACINHVCSITPKDKVNAIAEGCYAPRPARDSRGSGGLGLDMPKVASRSFTESPRSRDTSVDSAHFGADSNNSARILREAAGGYLKGIPPMGSRAALHTLRQPESFQVQEQPTAATPVLHTRFPFSTNRISSSTQLDESESRRATVFPGNYAIVQPPSTPSPGLQRAVEGRGSIPLRNVYSSPDLAYGSVSANSYPLPPCPRMCSSQKEAAHLAGRRQHVEMWRQGLENEDQVARRAVGLPRGRGPIGEKGSLGRLRCKRRLRRRRHAAIAVIFLAIITATVVLAITLTKKNDQTPTQSRWLNLTGYPPMPTGIATIVGPEPQVQNSGCIRPSSLWSCALPKQQQEANKPYGADQPNFRVLLQFHNETYQGGTVSVSSLAKPKSKGLSASAPSPSPPSIEDQTFIGKTTDMNSKPYAGEETPFYITFLPPVQLPPSKIVRRSFFPNMSALIPPPDETPDGTAAPASLYPLPEFQPIRLYNRGQSDEYYGFYTYFNRSIFLSSVTPLDGGQEDESPSDQNGGSREQDARVRCTWAQTRFLVQIWTQPTLAGMALESGRPFPPNAIQTMHDPSPGSALLPASISVASAANFTRPGSFPYPVTVTIDRHGGIAREKMVYCYGLNSEQHVNATEKKLEVEDRGFGGTLVRPAPGIFNNTDSSVLILAGHSDTDIGPVDGGTGGCLCQWTNWISQS